MTDWLDRLIGEWTWEADSVPANPDHRRTGVETVTRQGAWVMIESPDGYRFQLALDPASGRVTGDFIHLEHPDLWIYDGAPEGDRMVLTSRGPRMDGGTGETDYQDVWQTSSDDERIMTGRVLGDDGQWSDFTVTRYRRRTGP